MIRRAFILLALALPAAAFAAEMPQYTLTIKDHKFEPAELNVPANTPFIVKVKNLDATAEEIESSKLKIEKVFAGNGEGVLRVRALEAGRHEFTGEYHSDTAKGAFVAK